jgi:acyl carrier protein
MANHESWLAEVIALLARQFSTDADQLCGATRLVEDLYADSMELLDVVMALNEHFGIEINAEDMVRMATVDDIVALVARKSTT